MEPLPSHSHSYLTWHRSGSKSGFVLTILDRVLSTRIVGLQIRSNLSNEDRPSKQRLLRELSDSSLSIFRVSEFDDTMMETSVTDILLKISQAYPHPFDMPVGVIRTSAKSTSPANNPKRKLPSITILADLNPIFNQ